MERFHKATGESRPRLCDPAPVFPVAEQAAAMHRGLWPQPLHHRHSPLLR
jgi:hypothetical protein